MDQCKTMTKPKPAPRALNQTDPLCKMKYSEGLEGQKGSGTLKIHSPKDAGYFYSCCRSTVCCLASIRDISLVIVIDFCFS